ncbi:MAG: Dyp-type peroxidase, partial [Burkholderiales bacterium]
GRGVDAALILYAGDDEELHTQIGAQRRQLADLGHKILQEVRLRELPEKDKLTGELKIHEPFGFRDGISQPIMRGSKHWSKPENAMHMIEPGELVLGYRDNLGNLSPSPCCKGEDIGRNGTFLVIRQLEQDRAEFDKCIAREAERLEKDPRVSGFTGDELKHWVGARMVGRWRDGSSLVRYPHPPKEEVKEAKEPKANATAPAPAEEEKKNATARPVDNDFHFGREDPDGLRCPLGAHIRRANPRDSFEPDSPLQLAISNRHRILRVGRIYKPGNGEKPGLLFMCINADLERQFEFLQQTWLLGPNFHGLDDEIDPIVGFRGEGETMTVPTPLGPVRLQALSKFVKVLGGGYFFIPGRSATSFLVG